jgi:hypothetical protein
MRHGGKIRAARGIRRHWLKQRFAPNAAVVVKQQLAPFLAKRVVTNGERAVEIPAINLAKVSENGDWVVHRNGCRNNSAAKRAISGGTSA